MRTIKILGLAVVLILGAFARIEAQNWTIVPGQSVGPITGNSSEADLIKGFGRQNVKRVQVDVGEGETVPGTVIFPNDPRKRAYVLWRDTSARRQPESVRINSRNTLWKTNRGITIGTSLKTIEQLNGGAFVLTGFAWDYSGTVLHSNGGRLSELGVEKGEEIEGRTLLLRLEPTSAGQRTAEYNAVLGDEKFLSDIAPMQKLDPRVYEIIVVFPDRPLSGMDAAQIEKELIAALKDIQTYSSYGGGYDEQKLDNAQAVFEEKLSKYTKAASTLDHEFADLGQQMSIATSADGMLRIYSWDLEDGGTMHRFGRLYQYRNPDGKVYSMVEQPPDEGMGQGFVTEIFTLDTTAGKVYIVASTFIGSTKNYYQTASLYRIEGGKLNNNVNLIKTRSGITNTLRFEYDNFSVIDRTERPIKLITFDKRTGILAIPVVIKDGEFPDGRVTNRRINYRFNGQYFVKAN
jgi:hypothetical protein